LKIFGRTQNGPGVYAGIDEIDINKVTIDEMAIDEPSWKAFKSVFHFL
jgi:hypothetical protein